MGVTETQLAQFAKLGVSVKPDRRAFMRNLFGSVIERIILDPETGKFEIRYRLPITGCPLGQQTVWRSERDSNPRYRFKPV